MVDYLKIGKGGIVKEGIFERFPDLVPACNDNYWLKAIIAMVIFFDFCNIFNEIFYIFCSPFIPTLIIWHNKLFAI